MSDLNWQHSLKLWLFLDECCSHHLVEKIRQMYSDAFVEEDNFKVAHLTEFYIRGSDDGAWIPELRRKGANWVVITTDKGRDSKRAKLPVVCKEEKITHLIISSTIVSEGQESIKEALTTCWKHIRALPLLEKGTCATLGYTSVHGDDVPVIRIGRKMITQWFRDEGIEMPSYRHRRNRS